MATYDYLTADGAVAYHVDRCEPKVFRQWREIGGERVNGVKAGLYERSNFGGPWYPVKDRPRLNAETREFPAITPLPYRLPELLAASKEAGVLIAAGEKDADNLRALKLTATCNHGGEGKWWPELTPYLKDRRVFILCDNDEQGEKHQAVVGAALNGVANEIRVVRFPELPAKGDVSDFIERRRNDGLDDKALVKQLAERFKAAPAWAPTSSPSVTIVDDWPEPLSLPEGLSPVASLDMALLPAKIAPWVCDISERMQCPPDYVGSTALTALGSVLGRRIGIAPDRQTDWFEVPNLWQCAVGRPGAMKTPAIGEALKPLHRLEVKAREKYEGEAVDYGKALYEWKLQKEAAEARARADLKKNPEAKVSFDIAEPQAPIERRFITNDTTYEKLGEILAQNPNGVLAHRDELVSLLRTLDREEYAAARGFFLTAWGGKERYTFDRIGRGRVHIEGACLSMIGSTQPGRLAEYVRRAVSGTSGDDGLIQRFGLLVWPDQSPTWEHVDRYPLSDAREQAWRTFDEFNSLDPYAVGAHPISEYGGIPVLRLDAEAQDLFLEWRKGLEHRLRSPDSEMTPALRVALRQIPEACPFTSPHQSPGRRWPWSGRWGGDGARTWAHHLFRNPRQASLWRWPRGRDCRGQGHPLTHSEGEPCGWLFRKGCAPARVVEPERPRAGPGGLRPTLRPRLDCRRGKEEPRRRQTNHSLPNQPEGTSMTSYRNKYLEMLKTDFGKKPLPEEPSKPSKPPLRSSLSVLRVLRVRRIGPFQNFHPPGCRGGALRCLPEL